MIDENFDWFAYYELNIIPLLLQVDNQSTRNLFLHKKVLKVIFPFHLLLQHLYEYR